MPRRISKLNLAQAMMDTVVGENLPSANFKTNEVALFSKVEILPLRFKALKMTYTMESCVSPPFPVSDNCGVALLSTIGKSLARAKLKFHETKEQLLEISSRSTEIG